MGEVDGNAVHLDDQCPRRFVRRWRQQVHQRTGHSCIYCGRPSQSIDHVIPRSAGGLTVRENCVPACLCCNGRKGSREWASWYRRQAFYDPRRELAIRTWLGGNVRLGAFLTCYVQDESSKPELAIAS